MKTVLVSILLASGVASPVLADWHDGHGGAMFNRGGGQAPHVAQQTATRGENAFSLHTHVNALATVLLQQHKFFLHLHDEAKQMVRRAPVAVDLKAVGRVAAEAKASLKPEVHSALDGIVACASAGQLLPEYADQSFVVDLESHGGEAAKPLIDQWLDAERWLYETLLNAEEPLISMP